MASDSPRCDEGASGSDHDPLHPQFAAVRGRHSDSPSPLLPTRFAIWRRFGSGRRCLVWFHDCVGRQPYILITLGRCFFFFRKSEFPIRNKWTSYVNFSPTLLSLISLLVSSSQTSQQQLFHSKGFLIIAHALQSSSSAHLTMNVVQCIIGMAKFLLRCPAGVPLLKQLFDHILFNPKLWIKSQPEVQVNLCEYLALIFHISGSSVPVSGDRLPGQQQLPPYVATSRHCSGNVPCSQTLLLDCQTQVTINLSGDFSSFEFDFLTLSRLSIVWMFSGGRAIGGLP